MFNMIYSSIHTQLLHLSWCRGKWFLLKDFRNVSSVIYTTKTSSISNKKKKNPRPHKDIIVRLHWKASFLPLSITCTCNVQWCFQHIIKRDGKKGIQLLRVMLSMQDATASTDSVWAYDLRNKAVWLKYLCWCKANSSVYDTVSYMHIYWMAEQKPPFAHVSGKHGKNKSCWNVVFVQYRVNSGISTVANLRWTVGIDTFTKTGFETIR